MTFLADIRDMGMALVIGGVAIASFGGVLVLASTILVEFQK